MNIGSVQSIRRHITMALLAIHGIGTSALAGLFIASGWASGVWQLMLLLVSLASIGAALAYWRGWDPARYIAVLSFAFGAVILSPDPFSTEYIPLVLALPLVLAQLLTSARGVLAVGVIQMLALLARDGRGIYSHPLTITLYVALVVGLALNRYLIDSALAESRSYARRAREQESEARRRAERADALVRVAARLNAQLDLPATAAAVCEETVRALNVTSALLYLLSNDARELRLAGSSVSSPQSEPIATLSRSDFDALLQPHSPVIILPDVRALPGIERYVRGDVRSAAAVRLQREDRMIGLLIAVTVGEPRAFSEGDAALLRGLGDQAALAVANSTLYDEVARHLKNVQALRTIDQAITATHNLEYTLDVVLRQATLRLGVDAADVLLLRPADQTLVFAGAHGFRTDALRHTRLHLGEGYAGQAALQRTPVYAADLRAAPGQFARASALSGEGFVSYCSAPLLVRGQIKGVLETFHRAPLDNTPEWMEFFETLAGQAAVAIDNAELFEQLHQSNTELRQAYDRTIEGWSRALDLRDKETEGHSRRVTDLTLRLARRMGIDGDQLVHVRRGALLHDIGKMGIPDAILLKAGPLTAEEWATMRMHPSYAYDLLVPIDFLRPALEIPFCHHERWDGGGYPRGLAGEDIPLAARIFAVVDVWDALSSDRPYRPAWARRRVLAYIQSESGRHFDPRVVAALEAELGDSVGPG